MTPSEVWVPLGGVWGGVTGQAVGWSEVENCNVARLHNQRWGQRRPCPAPSAQRPCGTATKVTKKLSLSWCPSNTFSAWQRGAMTSVMSYILHRSRHDKATGAPSGCYQHVWRIQLIIIWLIVSQTIIFMATVSIVTCSCYINVCLENAH